MASSPSYDPNLVEKRYGEIEEITADCTPAAPLLNRASAGLYAPGSTFKVVTTSAALESNRFEPDSTFVDPGYCTVYGKRVNNFDTTSPFGRITLATALQYSVNSVFCEIGKALGAKAILDQAAKFGFYERPPLETPEGERLPSGLYRNGELWRPERNREVDAGPDGLRAGANARDAAPDGHGRRRDRQRGHRHAPLRRREARLPARNDRRADGEAAPLARRGAGDRPRRVGDDGARGRGGHRYRGSHPGLPDRREDGNGRDRRPGRNTVWFIAFAGREGERPSLAIAVVVEGQASTGGATAAPIARAVMEAILPSTSNP